MNQEEMQKYFESYMAGLTKAQMEKIARAEVNSMVKKLVKERAQILLVEKEFEIDQLLLSAWKEVMKKNKQKLVSGMADTLVSCLNGGYYD